MNKSELVEVAAKEAGITKLRPTRLFPQLSLLLSRPLQKGSPLLSLDSALSSLRSALRAPARIRKPAPL